MKTYFIPFFVTVAALFAATPYAAAYDCEVDGIYYSRISATEVEVTNKVFSDQNQAAYTGSITIPSSVTYNGKTFNVVSIGDYAFRDCSSITSITIPNSVTSIKTFAFFNCNAMTSVNVPPSVKEIGMGAFEGCASLTQMVLPKGILAVENETFFGCTSLKGVVIPASVTSVGEEAFSRCTSLISIYCLAKNAPECESNAFSKVDRTWCTLYVPKGSKSYKDSPVWQEFFVEENEDKSDEINLNASNAIK